MSSGASVLTSSSLCSTVKEGLAFFHGRSISGEESSGTLIGIARIGYAEADRIGLVDPESFKKE